MNISSIRQSLENIDYKWNNPKTYLVLVPGISLLIQKIQLSKILPLNPADQILKPLKSLKFVDICKCHLRGSLIQMMASVIAVKVFALPLFSIIGIVATYELINTAILGLKNPVTIYDFHKDNCTVKRSTIINPCNIF